MLKDYIVETQEDVQSKSQVWEKLLFLAVLNQKNYLSDLYYDAEHIEEHLDNAICYWIGRDNGSHTISEDEENFKEKIENKIRVFGDECYGFVKMEKISNSNYKLIRFYNAKDFLNSIEE